MFCKQEVILFFLFGSLNLHLFTIIVSGKMSWPLQFLFLYFVVVAWTGSRITYMGEPDMLGEEEERQWNVWWRWGRHTVFDHLLFIEQLFWTLELDLFTLNFDVNKYIFLELNFALFLMLEDEVKTPQAFTCRDFV